MPSWQRSLNHTVQYSNFRGTIPSNIHVSQTINIQGLPDQRHDNHGFAVTQSETLKTFFDRQRRYCVNRRAHHVIIEQFASDSECVADNSSDDLYDTDISDESGRSDGSDHSDESERSDGSDHSDESGRSDRSDDSDETAYAEAKGNAQDQLPRRPKLGCKTYKQEVEERGNAPKPIVNFYERLGLQRGATEEEIKAAARKMRIQVHPHRLITAETSKEEVERINEKASEVGEAAASLLDYLTRNRHDEELQQREWDNAR
ncbi:hypothetical protein MMC27_003207 [Xylographa pallens]|nr:hypothetical protein [Xylographa pallens]